MNVEKIKALIRLANNNPSDNEANTAARRVCRILAQNDFALLKPQSNIAAGAAKTWNDVVRSKEAEFRSKQPDGSTRTASWDDIYNHFSRSTYRPHWTDSAPHVDYKDKDDANWGSWGPRYNPFTTDPKTGQKKPRPQEKRKCAKCGLEIMTYRIKEDPWICNQCHWQDRKNPEGWL